MLLVAAFTMAMVSADGGIGFIVTEGFVNDDAVTTTDTGGGGGGLLTTTEKGEPAVGPAAADVDWTGFTGARMTVGAAAVTVGTVVMTVVGVRNLTVEP